MSFKEDFVSALDWFRVFLAAFAVSGLVVNIFLRKWKRIGLERFWSTSRWILFLFPLCEGLGNSLHCAMLWMDTSKQDWCMLAMA